MGKRGKMGTRRRSKGIAKTADKQRDFIAGALARVERDGFMPLAVIAKGATASQRLDVFDALGAKGLEVGVKAVRRPLEEQVESHLRESGSLPLDEIGKRVKGATAVETKEAIRALLDRQRARLVVRDGAQMLVAADHLVLDKHSLAKLAAVVAGLAKDLRIVGRKGGSLSRSDVERLVTPWLPKAAVPVKGRTATDNLGTLVERHREASGLTSVPKLVRILGGESARTSVHDELLSGARAGRFELRPESGMGRLSAEDASFCIPGPQGSRLAWVRRLEETS